MGMHAINCQWNSDRNARHNKLCATFADFAENCGLSPSTEVPVIGAMDVIVDVLEKAAGPRPVALDFGVTNPCRESTAHGASNDPGFAAGQ